MWLTRPLSTWAPRTKHLSKSFSGPSLRMKKSLVFLSNTVHILDLAFRVSYWLHTSIIAGLREDVPRQKVGRRLSVWNSGTVALSYRTRLAHKCTRENFHASSKSSCVIFCGPYFAVLTFAFLAWIAKIVSWFTKITKISHYTASHNIQQWFYRRIL